MRLPTPVATLTLLTLAACGPDPSTPPSGVPSASVTPPPGSATSSSTPLASASTTTTAKPNEPPAPPAGPRPSDADVKKFAKANNTFAFALWSKAAEKKGDVAFSPFSAETALSMAWLGAKGETAAQMKKALGFDVSAADAADIGGRFAKSLGGPVTIRVANRLFGEKTYSFDKNFLDTTNKDFGAGLEPLDFKNAADPSRVHINQWVAGETHDRIKDVIPPGGVSGETRLVLVNAIYFLGDWEEQFKKESTQPAAFHTTETAKPRSPTTAT
jgi:serpin B